MQTVFSDPQWILFDAAGTLIELSGPVGVTYASAFREFGIHISSDAMERAFRQAWKITPASPVTPAARPDDDRGRWLALVQKTLEIAKESLPPDQLEECFDALYLHFAQPGVWRTMPHVEEVLSELHGRYRLAVLSNFDQRLHRILQDLKMDHFFEHILVSSRLGADKPAPEAFQRALRILDAEPAQVLHVGDDPDADWQGARNAGLRVFELQAGVRTLRDLAGSVKKLQTSELI